MSYETILIYSEPLLRRAVFAFWRRSIGAGLVVGLLIVAFILIWVTVTGEASGLTGVLITALVIGILAPVILYSFHCRNLLHTFREMDKPQATFHVDETSFTLSSSLNTTTLPWSEVKELWQFPDIWLLLYSKAQFSTLPLACLPLEMQTFIVQQVKAAGGKV